MLYLGLWQQQILPCIFPLPACLASSLSSCSSIPALELEWWDHILWFCWLWKLGFWLLPPSSSPQCLHLMHLHHDCLVSCLVSCYVGYSYQQDLEEIEKAKDGKEMRPFGRNRLFRDLNFLKSQFSGLLGKYAGSGCHFQDGSSSHFSFHHLWQDEPAL